MTEGAPQTKSGHQFPKRSTKSTSCYVLGTHRAPWVLPSTTIGLLENYSRTFEFGACSLQTLPRLQYANQKTLHSSQTTLIHFTTTVDDTPCDVSFTFTPFRFLCNLTYYKYEIHCLIPHSTPHERLRRRSIIDIAQRLYEIHFSKSAGYRLELLETK